MLSRYICFLISVFIVSCIKDTNNIVSAMQCTQKNYSPPFSDTALGAVSKVPLRIVQNLLL